jgi:hypothetical protein
MPSQLFAAMDGTSLASTQDTVYLSGNVVPPSIVYTSDTLTGISQAVALSGNMVPPLITFSDVKNKLVSSSQAATIQVTYHAYPSAAQAAFDYAATIWSSILVSTVPITIDAYGNPCLPVFSAKQGQIVLLGGVHHRPELSQILGIR